MSSGHGTKLYQALSKFILLLEFMISVLLWVFLPVLYALHAPLPTIPGLHHYRIKPFITSEGGLRRNKEEMSFLTFTFQPLFKAKTKDSYSCSKKQTGHIRVKRHVWYHAETWRRHFWLRAQWLSSSKPTSSALSSVISEQELGQKCCSAWDQRKDKWDWGWGGGGRQGKADTPEGRP